MTELKDMVGKVKRIHNKGIMGIKVYEAMIVEYTYSPERTDSKKHKLDYVTTSGVTGHMFVSESTIYEDIEVSEHVMRNLTLLRESIVRKKEAQSIIIAENDNIKMLTVELLKEEFAMDADEFEKKLTEKLEEKGAKYNRSSYDHGKYYISYILSNDMSLTITRKNHYIQEVRLRGDKSTGRNTKDLTCVEAFGKHIMKVTNHKEYDKFLENIKIKGLMSKEFDNYVRKNILEKSWSDDVFVEETTGDVYYKFLCILKREDRNNVVVFNDEAINMILGLLEFTN